MPIFKSPFTIASRGLPKNKNLDIINVFYIIEKKI